MPYSHIYLTYNVPRQGENVTAGSTKGNVSGRHAAGDARERCPRWDQHGHDNGSTAASRGAGRTSCRREGFTQLSHASASVGPVREARYLTFALHYPEPLTTTVSTKAQVALPSTIRRALGWAPGTQLAVVTAPGGVLLKPAPEFPETRSDDVFGLLACSGPPRSLSEMEAGIVAEAKRRHASD